MEEELFVDKHRVELIQRVTNVAPILDELHFYNVINQENYDKIRAIHDSRETLRELLSGPLQSSGVSGKQIFYKILQRNEPHLIDDLKRKESETVMDIKVLDTLQVNTMVDKKLLIEILNDLSSEEFEKFKWFIELEKDFPLISRSRLNVADMQETVELMVKMYSRDCVEVTKKVLKEMNRTDLVQRFSDISSRTKEKHSVDEQWPALFHKVETMTSVIELLLETLADLSDRELEDFKQVLWNHLSFTRRHFHNRWWILMTTDMPDIVLIMVREYGQQSVEVTKKVLKDINRPDLVKRLSDCSSGPKGHSRSLEIGAHEDIMDETMTPVKGKLLETLEELSFEEIELFKWFLQPLVPRVQTELADIFDLVDLMVKIYGQQSVEVTREVLKEMNRTDLVQTLLDTSSGSKGPSGSLEFEAHGSIMDSSDWTKLEPEVNCTDADEAPTYSLQSEAGKFECSVSDLRWVCKEKVSFKYQFCSWEEHMERMESLQYMPAGPLLDITVTAGKLNEVYLPHWICTDDSTILDKFAVLHIDACGDVVEDVSEVTSSHVKLSEPLFSPRAVLMKLGFPVKIKCHVLIYYKPNTTFLKLHVYLIPHDPALQQMVDKMEFSAGYEIIDIKSRPDGYLRMQQGFVLTADIDTAKILPKKLTLRYDSQDPNFYEVFIENPDRDFHLSLSTFHSNTNKSEPVCEPVWTCEIRKDDYPRSGNLEAVGSSSGATGGNTLAEGEHTVDELSALVQKAATITTDKEKLLDMLRCLREEDFNDFKWFLQDRNLIPEDLPCITPIDLAKADRKCVVDLMEQTYSQRAVEVTKMLFKKINLE